MYVKKIGKVNGQKLGENLNDKIRNVYGKQKYRRKRILFL